MAVQLASAYMQIIPSMQGFQGTIARQLSGEGASAGQAVGGRFTSGFKGIVGAGAIAGAVGGLAGAAAGAVGGALSRGFAGAKDAIIGFNSTLQQSSIGFTTMLGSATKAQSFVANLQSFAAKTPFEFQGLVQNSNTMLGMGIAAKDVIPDLTALGDSVASVGGDGTVLNNTISAFSQTMAKGTLDMGNMNQLLQGGVPNALKILASSYHVTTGEMVKMISAGKVQSADALPRLIKGIEQGTKSTAALGGMMDKQSVTFQGAMSNIADASTQLLAKAFKPLFTQASAGANALAKVLGAPQMTVWAGKIAAGTTVVIGAFNRLRTGVAGFFTSFSGGGQIAPLMSFFSQMGAALAPLIPALIQAALAFSPIRIAFQALAPVLPVVTVALTQLSSALGAGLLSVVTALAPAIVGIVNGLVQFVVPLLRIPPLVQGIVVGFIAWRAISTGMAVVSAIMTGIGAATAGAAAETVAAGLASRIYAIATTAMSIATKVAAAGQWLLNAAMSANPIGIVVVAIAALVAGLVWFFTQTKVGQQIWAGFVGALANGWNQLVAGWNVVAAALANGWNQIVGGVRVAFNAVVGFLGTWGPTILAVLLPVIGIPLLIAQHWGQIVTVVRTVWNAVVGYLAGVMNVVRNAVLIPIGLIIVGWRVVWGLLGPIVRNALNAIIGFVAPIINGIRTVIVTVVSSIVTAWNRYWQALSTAVRVVFTVVVGFVTAYINRVRVIVTTVVSAIVAVWTATWNRILAVFRPVWNAIASVVTTVIGRVRAVIAAGVAFVSSVWSAAWNRVVAVLRAAWNAIVSAVSSAVGRVVTFVHGIGSRVVSAVSGFGSLLFNAGKNLIQGLINGVSSMIGGLVHTVTSIAGKAVAAAKSALGIHSPSTVFHGIGQNLVAGFVNGINRGHDEAHAAIQGLTGNMKVNSNVRLAAAPTVTTAPHAGLGVAGSGFPSTVTLIDKDGSILGHMDARIRRYDLSQQLAGAR